MADFGDYEPADALDDDQTIAPEWVAHRVHELRDWLDRMSGGDGLPPFDSLPFADMAAAMHVAQLIVEAVQSRHGDAEAAAHEEHDRLRLERPALPSWADLPDDERAVAVALIRALVDALTLEGHTM